jgi:DNA polymerase-3 subunit delta'
MGHYSTSSFFHLLNVGLCAKMRDMRWGMLGHQWAVDLLAEHIVRNQIRHAYLLCGPEGIGRRTLALRLAQALNCPDVSPAGDPCQMATCRSCRQMEAMQHPDLSVVQAEAAGSTLKVEQVRELQHALALHPYEGRWRIALLLRFQEATVSAMNALLKTLEEPAPRVILILTAESPESLLPTIVSRCEVLRLRSLPFDQVSQALAEDWGLETTQAEHLAHISAGRPGYALQLYKNPDLLEQRQARLEVLQRLLSASRVERFAFSEGLVKDEQELRGLLLLWSSYWRDVVLCAAGTELPLVNTDWIDQIRAEAGRFGLPVAYQMLSSIQRTLRLIDETNVNQRIATEVLMLDMPHR